MATVFSVMNEFPFIRYDSKAPLTSRLASLLHDNLRRMYTSPTTVRSLGVFVIMIHVSREVGALLPDTQPVCVSVCRNRNTKPR